MTEEIIKTIKYAVDQTVLLESEKDLKFVIESIVRVAKVFGMKTYVGKTKVMGIGKNEGIVKISFERITVVQVNRDKYLGSTVTCKEEHRSRFSY